MASTRPAVVNTARGSPDRPIRHLNQIDLSRRWNVSPRTLERWRWLKQGPEYLKIGGHVVYRLEDVEAFEVAQAHRPSLNPTGHQPKHPIK
jgi:hypothetical protein